MLNAQANNNPAISHGSFLKLPFLGMKKPESSNLLKITWSKKEVF